MESGAIRSPHTCGQHRHWFLRCRSGNLSQNLNLNLNLNPWLRLNLHLNLRLSPWLPLGPSRLPQWGRWRSRQPGLRRLFPSPA